VIPVYHLIFALFRVQFSLSTIRYTTCRVKEANIHLVGQGDIGYVVTQEGHIVPAFAEVRYSVNSAIYNVPVIVVPTQND
jgi:hypothetical protein